MEQEWNALKCQIIRVTGTTVGNHVENMIAQLLLSDRGL